MSTFQTLLHININEKLRQSIPSYLHKIVEAAIYTALLIIRPKQILHSTDKIQMKHSIKD